MRPVPQFDARSWLLKALRETPRAMESLLWEVEDQLLERRDSDEWSCGELVCHMAEMERRYADRLELMARADEPRIPAFDGDSIDMCPPSTRRGVFDAMEEFEEQRRRTVYVLWSLDDDDWERRGVHPYLGPLTVLQVTREMNEHDLSHLWQLRRLCDALEAATA